MTELTVSGAVGPGSFRAGRVLEQSLVLLWQNFPKIFLLSALAALPHLLVLRANQDTFGRIVAHGLTALFIRDRGIAEPLPLLSAFLMTLGQAAISYGVFQTIRGESLGIGEAFRRLWSCFWPLLGMLICYWLAVVLGFVLFFVPGVMLITRWWVALPACMIEQRGPLESLGRSAELTRGHGTDSRLTVI